MAKSFSHAYVTPGQRFKKAKRPAKRGKIWVRKKDGVEFILDEETPVGLRFRGYPGLFSLTHFEPKR